MSLPAKIDLYVYRGDSWAQRFRLKHDQTPIDLTTATAESEARNRSNERFPLVVEITDAAGGELSLSLPPEGLPPTVYEYDIEVTDGADITTWIAGHLTVNRDVTNEPSP